MTDIVLFIQSDDGETRAQRLRVDGTLSIGRHHENTVCLDSDLVSRRHARVEILEDGLRVEDASSNGTMAGDVLLRRELLDVAYGTPLKIGNYTLQIDPAPAPAPAPLPARAAPKPPRPPAPTMPPAGPPLRPSSAMPVVTPSPSPSRPPAVKPEPSGPSLSALAASLAPTLTRFAAAARVASETEDDSALRRAAHRELARELGPAAFESPACDAKASRARAVLALRRIVERLGAPGRAEALATELAAEALGLGPLEALLADPSVRVIQVTSPRAISVETERGLVTTVSCFTDDDAVRAVLARLLAPTGRRVDPAQPVIDARLPDGAHVHAILWPVARHGACLTLRRATAHATMEQMVGRGALTREMARFLALAVASRKNVLVAGGAGSGKTGMLNALCGAIPESERVVTVERTAELSLVHPHLVSLLASPSAGPSPEGEAAGAPTARALVEGARRMRADRIVVDECEGDETRGLLDALDAGHAGAIATTRARSPREALRRIEALASARASEPEDALRARVAMGLQVVVLMTRVKDGRCEVSAVDEVDPSVEGPEIALRPLFRYARAGSGSAGDGPPV